MLSVGNFNILLFPSASSYYHFLSEDFLRLTTGIQGNGLAVQPHSIIVNTHNLHLDRSVSNSSRH